MSLDVSDVADVSESNDVSVEFHANGEQTLLVVDGDRVGGVIALDDDVDTDDAVALVDTIEAEVGHLAPGIRSRRDSVAEVYRGP